MTINEFVKNKPYLFWYIKDPENLSDNSIIENVLNYGDFNDFKILIQIMGINKVSDIFMQQLENNRNNFRPEIENYFKLYFTKYAQRNFK